MNLIHRMLLILALVIPAAMATSPAAAAGAATRHYDCSKAGNANKAACKGAAPTAKPETSSKTKTPTRTTTTKTAASNTTRHYDCTKAGNANKAACKTGAAQTASGKAPGATKTTTTSSTTTDCTKWYNRMHAVCRTNSASSGPQTTVTPSPKPVANAGFGESVNSNPSGAIAQCKDGTYSHAKTHSGACSHHGGVAKWTS